MQKTKNKQATFQSKEIASLFSFELNSGASFSVSTDSRSIKKEDIFLPLKGEKFDGHDFINSVLDKLGKKAGFSFCERAKIKKVKSEYQKNLILVENTLDAYHELANYYRKKVNPKVVGITGSSGKTTVKDLIATVLSQKYKTHKTQSNFNNEIGVPKTILEMPEDTEVLVLELAMRGKGQIRKLSLTSEPDVAVITSIGLAHIGILGDLNSILKAKSEILEGLNKGGIAVLYNDPKLVECAEKLKQMGKLQYASMTFDLGLARGIYYMDGKSNFVFDKKMYSVNALGKIHVLNSICAILTARYLKLTEDEIKKGLLSFNVPDGRGNIIKIKDSIYLIDESYNANPDSLKVAVTSLVDCWGSEYVKILILGELAELGEREKELLRELGNWLAKQPLTEIITVGNRLKQITSHHNAKDTKECCDILKKLLIGKGKVVILVKGSHIAGLEKVIKKLSG